MNIDINVLIAEYGQTISQLQHENIMLKVQVKQLQKQQEESTSEKTE